MSQTRKERIQKEKKEVKTALQEKTGPKETKKQEEEVVETMIANTKTKEEKKQIDWKKLSEKTKEETVKISKRVIEEIKKGTKIAKEKTVEWNKKRIEEKEKWLLEQEKIKESQVYEAKNLHCQVGYPLHKQKFQYGKGTIEFSFGGYLNEHTITIIVESTLGVRSHSSACTFQVEKGTEFHLPGLYNDGTAEFKSITLKVMELNPKENSIHFEKNEK